jgi:methyl-accepting chemotaxis protein
VGSVGNGAREADGAITDVAKAMQQLVSSAEDMRSVVRQQRDLAQMIETTAITSASGTDEMAKRIGGVARAAAEATDLSSDVQGSADSLVKLAGQLKSAADQFLVHLRAA